MFGKQTVRNLAAWTLVEMMVVVAIFSICGIALASFSMFGARSFAVLSNYAILDKANRQAMDQLTSEIRNAQKVTSYTTNPPALSLINQSGLKIGRASWRERV